MELSALPFSCCSDVLGLLLLFIVEACLQQESFKSHPFYKSQFRANSIIYINSFNYAPINCINCYLVESEKTISNPLSLSLRIPPKEGINPFITSISKILFLPCLMHKNEYNKTVPIPPSLSPCEFWVLYFGGYDTKIFEAPNQHNSISLSNAFQITTGYETRTNFPWPPQVK